MVWKFECKISQLVRMKYFYMYLFCWRPQSQAVNSSVKGATMLCKLIDCVFPGIDGDVLQFQEIAF